MKKIIAVLMALLMLLSCCAAVAETEINWADVEGVAAEMGLEGQWVASEDWDAGFFLPSVFGAVEVPEEMVEQGVMNIFTTADGSAKIVVMYV